MSEAKTRLQEAFLEDHQHLTRGLHRIAEALEKGDLQTAVAAAEEVDRKVGPHMRFEEEEFYPRLRQALGDEFVDRLYDEHSEGQEAIRQLLTRGETVPLEASERTEIGSKVKIALEHALGCGTLLSHLDALADSEHQILLERLLSLRTREERWSRQTTSRAAKS
jgi:leucyl aminopeptidase (aminopeptidase T)